MDTFLLLAEHFPNLDIRGWADETLLQRTSYGGHLEIGRWLLDRGADINALTNFNWTPLHAAAFNGRLEFVRMLLDHGAAINSPDKSGRTPLHRSGHIEVVRLLLEYGADLNARDEGGRTPSDFASIYGYRGVVRLLSEYSTKSVEE